MKRETTQAASRCTEQRVVVRFQSPSGMIHGIHRRDKGGNGKFLCGRIGEGWEYKGYGVEITCRQCLSRNASNDASAT